MEHVHFEHFVVNNGSNHKMNICHVFQPACCSMVLLNIHTPSEPLECDPFRDINIYIYVYCILGGNRFGSYVFPTVQIANGPLLFFQDLREDNCNKQIRKPT